MSDNLNEVITSIEIDDDFASNIITYESCVSATDVVSDIQYDLCDGTPPQLPPTLPDTTPFSIEISIL